MRIEYSYTNYKNSKRATDTSHFFNMILSYIEFILGAGNLVAILGFGVALFEVLGGVSESSDLNWFFFVIVIPVALVDYIIVILHLFLDYCCERMAIQDDYTYKNEMKEIILKNHKQQSMKKIKLFSVKYFAYLPFALIGICSISVTIYGLLNNLLLFVGCLLITFADVAIIILIKKKIS